MAGLKLAFEKGAGDLILKDGQLVVEDDLNTLVLTSEFSDARAEADDPVDPLNPQVQGYWAEVLMAINGRRWGSKYWLYRRQILNDDVANALDDTARECTQHLRDNGIVETITVETEKQNGNRVAQQITYTEPGDEEPTRITFRNLWDFIRSQI